VRAEATQILVVADLGPAKHAATHRSVEAGAIQPGVDNGDVMIAYPGLVPDASARRACSRSLICSGV
jgi:hypothetical protein